MNNTCVDRVGPNIPDLSEKATQVIEFVLIGVNKGLKLKE